LAADQRQTHLSSPASLIHLRCGSSEAAKALSLSVSWAYWNYAAVRKLLFGWRDTGEFVSDQLRTFASNAWELVDLVSHGSELVDGHDPFFM
jgi:hypothetical protein